MQVDRKVISALDSDTRIKILKALCDRRKFPAELSKELGISSPTVVIHLRKLETAGLVTRNVSHRKWVYYEITQEGRDIIAPRFPIRATITLLIGAILVFSIYSAASYFTSLPQQGGSQISDVVGGGVNATNQDACDNLGGLWYNRTAKCIFDEGDCRKEGGIWNISTETCS